MRDEELSIKKLLWLENRRKDLIKLPVDKLSTLAKLVGSKQDLYDLTMIRMWKIIELAFLKPKLDVEIIYRLTKEERVLYRVLCYIFSDYLDLVGKIIEQSRASTPKS
ncbi:MAG: hypothetical protein DRJ49_00020 [Thermoprotei archaeon]|nr:MAG: hypothetical protein DRN53_04540 [Thermoprotei archaeon]RLE90318.1 MAG: hypothetical protein DRJ49_00020 [Thermoprotei archaeon]